MSDLGTTERATLVEDALADLAARQRGANRHVMPVGVAIGLLPEDDAQRANRYLSVALPTGLGITRNSLIARSSLCLVAVGGGLGTLSEIALGLQWGKPVFAACGAPLAAGVETFASADVLLVRAARWLTMLA